MNIYKILFYIVLFLNPLSALFGQEKVQKIHGFFDKDSIKIGESIKYTLFFRHAPDMEFVFPDSAFNFRPFEYVDKKFFPTQTNDSISTDSVVYSLTTFEIDKLQKLRIPILVYHRGNEKIDTLYPLFDSVYLVEMVDSTALDPRNIQSDISWAQVKKKFNYPYLIVTILVISIISLLIWLVFGKSVRKIYLLRKLRKYNAKFILTFDRLLYGNINREVVEELLQKWKKHTGNLTGLPITSYTTREISYSLSNIELKKALQAIDQTIYADIHIESAQLQSKLIVLKEHALEVFKQKIKDIQNG